MSLNPVIRQPGAPIAAVDDALAQQFPWGSIQWLANYAMMPEATITFGFVQIVPGSKNPRHYHPNSDEVLYLLEGVLDHSLGAEVHRLLPGMAIHIPLGVEHVAINRSEQGARMVVAYSTGDRQTVMRETGEE
jgi:uncharacterized cupin superfamily protein